MSIPSTKQLNVSRSKLLRRFCKNVSGSIAPIAALTAMPIFMGLGAAIDGARIAQEKTAFYAAVDSAVIAVAADDRSSISSLSGEALAERMAELEGFAEDYLMANYSSQLPEGSDIEMELTVTGQKIRMDASLNVPTTMLGFAGFESWKIKATSEVSKAMRPIELVMVMDTTGSMNTDNKLDGAQDAARSLLETLYGGTESAEPNSEFIRVALVPFSGAVKLDTSAYDFNLDWIDTAGSNTYSKLNMNAIATTPSAWNNYYAWSQLKKTSSAYHTWNGCVEARANDITSGSATDYLANDVAPVSSNSATLFPAYFNPDVVGSSVGSNSYGVSYIGGTSTTAVGSECRGLTSTVCSSTSTTNLRVKQENYNKYIATNIGLESANPSSTTSSYNGPWGGCAVSKVVPMTYDRTKVENGIDAMRAHGITVIPEGLAWGWRAISPSEPFTKVESGGSIPASTISPYDDTKWQKILVLMTDGDNNVNGGSYTLNSSRYSAYGYGSEGLSNNRFGTTTSSSFDDSLNTNMETLCESIKDKHVTIYVASFGNDINDDTKDRLKACATSVDHYEHASSSADLQAFFDHIGEDVINKSIYVSK